MRPGASRFLPLALAALLIAPDVEAAPAGRSAGPGFGGGVARPPGQAVGTHRGYRVRLPAGTVGGTAFHAGRAGPRSRAAFAAHRFGYGYGAFYPLPLGYGYAWPGDGLEDGLIELQPPAKPEWPTAIGIPPSPVQPPALYVIGAETRGKARLRRSGRAGTGTVVISRGSPGRVAAGPVFIPVPSGR